MPRGIKTWLHGGYDVAGKENAGCRGEYGSIRVSLLKGETGGRGEISSKYGRGRGRKSDGQCCMFQKER